MYKWVVSIFEIDEKNGIRSDVIKIFKIKVIGWKVIERLFG